MLNFVSNAIKFSNKGGIVSVHVAVTKVKDPAEAEAERMKSGMVSLSSSESRYSASDKEVLSS